VAASHRRIGTLTRRTLLTATFATGASAAVPARAEPPPLQPVSKAEAKYQAAPRGMFSCAVCSFFVKPRACKVVQGDISPHGWCKFFDMPD
jgi:hypothetical protein